MSKYSGSIMWNAASRLGVAACLLGLSLPLAAEGQAPPDLSGKWTQNNQLTTPLGTTDRVYTETIEQHGDVLKVLVRDVSIPTVFIDERSYTTDGQPHTAPTGSGERTTTAKWVDGVLRVDAVHRARSGIVTQTLETWVVSADGRTLTKTIDTRGPDGEVRARIVLERRD